MKWLMYIRAFIIVLLFCTPVFLPAQHEDLAKDVPIFFQELAKEDALHEQSLRLTDEEDQADYWNDQHSFEAQLKKFSYKTYLSYLKEKTMAYTAHEQECSATCGHGTYYFRQAEYYKQFNSNVLTTQLSSVDEKATAGKLGVIQKEDQQ